MKRNSSIWWILQDSNQFRSFELSDRSASFSDITDQFRDGRLLSDEWTPLPVRLFEDQGEEGKPIGDFPTIAGTVPLVISARALGCLLPIIEPNVEVLALDTDIGDFHALNIGIVDCLDLDKSEVARFKSSGRIMRIEHYEFLPDCLDDIHLFRLPEEPLSRTFSDDVFKEVVESNGLEGLIFSRVA